MSQTIDLQGVAEFETVTQMFRNAARNHPDRVYCVSDGVRLTYAQAARAIGAVAADLAGASGRSVVLVLPNSAAFLIAYFGALEAGAYPALVNYAHPDATVGKLVAGLDIAAVYSDRDLPEFAVTHFDDAAVHTMANGPAIDLPTRTPTPQDIGAIMFSGGTTGLPKQIAHRQSALVAKVVRMDWAWPMDASETWLPVAPFTHIYGYLMGALNPVLRAGTLVIPKQFHPDLIVDMLQQNKVTVFGGGPPAIYQAIMASQKFADARFPDLRVCPGGGAPFPVDLHKRWQAATGVPITEGYGMTEIAPITVNKESHGIKPGAAGKPVPDTIVQIVDVSTGNKVMPQGETGEIRVKGPHMMTGYTDNPDETALTLRDGFVYTGDIGMLDADGFLTISDRKKDVIFVKGFNVFPREIEETLLSQDAVSGACVVGRKDARAGEVPVAYVTLRAPASETELSAHCEAYLTGYKLPARIVTLDALPLTPTGKVDRTALRAAAAE